MRLLDYFKRKRKPTANVARERLQIILAREHTGRDEPDYLPALKHELLAVVAKYVNIDKEAIQVSLEREGNCEILELNITLPETENAAEPVRRGRPTATTNASSLS